MMRFVAVIACISVALDCFANDESALGLPIWFWTLIGIGWLINGLIIAFHGTDQ